MANDFVFPTRTGKDKYIQTYNTALKLWKVNFVETDVMTKYGSAHVIICGPKTGEPLVLFHGTDASSTMWFPNVKALSKKYRVYAIDYPLETGKSVASVQSMNPKEMILFYNEVFNYFKLRKINVVAASRGGWVAMLIALEAENKVAKLVLLSPAQTFGGVDKLHKAMTALALKIFPSRKRLDAFFKGFSFYPEKIDSTYKEQFYLANKFGRSKPDLMKMGRFDEADLKTLQIPVLVLVGDHDVINNVNILEKAVKTIPNVETTLIKNSGHFLSVDQPEVVNKRILDFLLKNQ